MSVAHGISPEQLPGGSNALEPRLKAWLTSYDLFALGRLASAARMQAFGDRGHFGIWRRLHGDGAWVGAPEAPLALVDDRDLPALGGWAAARAAGATVLLADVDAPAPAGAEVMLRLTYHHGEPAAARRQKIEAAVARANQGPVRALLPMPDGELQSLDTIRLYATLRLALDVERPVHLAVDTRMVGPRLAQMALAFGADEIVAPIVLSRALRLGENARNPDLTRAEVCRLLRMAGLHPCERLAGGEVREEPR